MNGQTYEFVSGPNTKGFCTYRRIENNKTLTVRPSWLKPSADNPQTLIPVDEKKAIRMKVKEK